MLYIFRTLTAAISIYSLLCIIRIFLTWIPGLSYSPFGRFLSGICDPFLNLFSGIRWLRFGAIDFSPIFALAVLSMASFIFERLSRGTQISFAMILALVIETAWSIAAAIILFLIIIVAIRLVVAWIGSDRNSSLWYQLDSSLSPFVYSITKLFSGGRPVAYKNALVFALVMLIVLRFGGGIVVGIILNACFRIPF